MSTRPNRHRRRAAATEPASVAAPPAAAIQPATLPLEALYARREDIKNQQAQAIATVNAVNGAMQLIEQLITQAEAAGQADAKP